jgi:hypothetical protein
MRRLVSAGVIAITSLALATPALTSTAAATPHTADTAVVAAKAKAGKFKIKKSAPGVQPGVSKLVLTSTGLKGKGKVKYTVTGGSGVVLKAKAKVKKGKAKYLVPALGTGHYKVKASFKGRKGKTKFEVYDSAVTLSSTTLTCPRSDYSKGTRLTGSVKYKGAPATGGWVDIYMNGNNAGGSDSPYLLTIQSVTTAGTFDFGTRICLFAIKGNGKTGNAIQNGLPNGQHQFQAYFERDAGYDDYISSNYFTVNIVP